MAFRIELDYNLLFHLHQHRNHFGQKTPYIDWDSGMEVDLTQLRNLLKDPAHVLTKHLVLAEIN